MEEDVMKRLSGGRYCRRAVLTSLFGLLAVGTMGFWPAAYQKVSGQQPVRLNPMIERLAKGETSFSDVDWKFLDWEHGSYELDRLESTLEELAKKKTASGQLEVVPIVRIPMEGDEPFRWIVKQVLELGAYGIVFPNVETKEQALKAVRAMRFPPLRGVQNIQTRRECGT